MLLLPKNCLDQIPFSTLAFDCRRCTTQNHSIQTLSALRMSPRFAATRAHLKTTLSTSKSYQRCLCTKLGSQMNFLLPCFPGLHRQTHVQNRKHNFYLSTIIPEMHIFELLHLPTFSCMELGPSQPLHLAARNQHRLLLPSLQLTSAAAMTFPNQTQLPFDFFCVASPLAPTLFKNLQIDCCGSIYRTAIAVKAGTVFSATVRTYPLA